MKCCFRPDIDPWLRPADHAPTPLRVSQARMPESGVFRPPGVLRTPEQVVSGMAAGRASWQVLNAIGARRNGVETNYFA